MTRSPAELAPAGSGQILVGIDAGGTAIRARAVRAGQTLHEGNGGPGNPRTVDLEELQSNYQQALAGCPPPARITAAVAGAGGQAMQERVWDVLHALFPLATVSVTPDYVAAYYALSSGTALCVIAGTGSVVCSQKADSTWAVSGGRGWVLGDHGSAARLGQAVLEWYVHDPDSAPEGMQDHVARLFGDASWPAVVAQVQRSPTPASLLGRAAPVLTALAEQGHPHALALLQEQMGQLARTVADHAAQHLTVLGTPTRAGLVGGVWQSPVTRTVFTTALRELTAEVVVEEPASRPDPVEGALRLAGGLAA